MFKSVKTKKASEHLFEQTRKAIYDGRLRPGDKLPPEKDLNGLEELNEPCDSFL